MAEQLTPAQQQALQDAKDAATRKKEEKAGAPTLDRPVSTKKLNKGGKIRGGGCEQRGKTKGRFV